MLDYIPLFLLLLLVSVDALSISAGSLRTEGLPNPKGVSVSSPRLTWFVDSSLRGDSQVYYEIRVGSTSDAVSNPDLWNSSKVVSSVQSANYNGTTLESRTIAYWAVRIWNSQGQVSDWSEIGTFEMGLLNASDWTAEWIGNTNYKKGSTSLQYLGLSLMFLVLK